MEQYQIERIKRLMAEKGMNAQQLAAASGNSAMTISRVLNKPELEFTQKTIRSILNALGVDEQYLYDAEDEAEFKPKSNIIGFVEYNGKTFTIKKFGELESLYNQIVNDKNLPKRIKEIKAKDRENKKSQKKYEVDINAIDLRREEEYDTSAIKTFSFLRTNDARNGHSINIGNFSSEHGLDICGEHFLNSECAYIVGLFSGSEENAEVQKRFQFENTPNDAKFIVRANFEEQGCGRKDWDEFKDQWMLYVVWNKCLSNQDFAELLSYIPNDVIIIENTTNQDMESSLFWGAKNKEFMEAQADIEKQVALTFNPNDKDDDVEYFFKEIFKNKKRITKDDRLAAKQSIERNKINNIGVWKGVNCLGKCLTICKFCLDNGITPPINYDLLRSKKIYLFGKLLTFDDAQVSLTPSKLKKKSNEDNKG